MEEFFRDFHFLRPWYLLLLFLPLLFYWKFFRGVRNKSSWEAVCDKRLLDFLLVRGSSAQRRAVSYLAFAGFVGAVLALSGPTWQKKEVPDLAPENPVMLLLNMSTDMAVRDLTPNRLTRAKFEISDLLKLLQNVQAGLIVYTREPFLITPITEDLSLIENLLPAVVFNIMPANGDRLDRAVALAVEKFQNAQYASGSIVVFTSDIGERFDLALEEAEKAKTAGFVLNVVAVSPQIPEKLKLLAAAGGGVCVGSGTAGVEQIAREIEKTISDELKFSENLRSDWDDFGYFLLIIPLLCCLYFFRRGILVLAFVLGGTVSAQAGFFLNSNQEGLKAYNGGDYQAAAQTFEDSRWKASALYKAGNYEEAFREFSKNGDAEALYNQGNALAKSGKIEEAVKKYEEVLQKEPGHEDAKFNLEYLKRQQEQQNQQQQNQDKQEQQNQQQSQPQSGAENNRRQGQEQQRQDNQSQGQQNNYENRQADDEDGQSRQEQPQAAEGQQDGQNDSKQSGLREDEKTGDRRRDAEKQSEEQKSAAAELQKGDENAKYDEEVQRAHSSTATSPKMPAVCSGRLFKKNTAKTDIRNEKYEEDYQHFGFRHIFLCRSFCSDAGCQNQPYRFARRRGFSADAGL